MNWRAVMQSANAVLRQRRHQRRHHRHRRKDALILLAGRMDIPIVGTKATPEGATAQALDGRAQATWHVVGAPMELQRGDPNSLSVQHSITQREIAVLVADRRLTQHTVQELAAGYMRHITHAAGTRMLLASTADWPIVRRFAPLAVLARPSNLQRGPRRIVSCGLKNRRLQTEIPNLYAARSTCRNQRPRKTRVQART